MNQMFIYILLDWNFVQSIVHLLSCCCKPKWAHCVPSSSEDGTVVVDHRSSRAVRALSLMLGAEAFHSAHHTRFPVSVAAWLLPRTVLVRECP